MSGVVIGGEGGETVAPVRTYERDNLMNTEWIDLSSNHPRNSFPAPYDCETISLLRSSQIFFLPHSFPPPNPFRSFLYKNLLVGHQFFIQSESYLSRHKTSCFWVIVDPYEPDFCVGCSTVKLYCECTSYKEKYQFYQKVLWLQTVIDKMGSNHTFFFLLNTQIFVFWDWYRNLGLVITSITNFGSQDNFMHYTRRICLKNIAFENMIFIVPLLYLHKN